MKINDEQILQKQMTILEENNDTIKKSVLSYIKVFVRDRNTWNNISL